MQWRLGNTRRSQDFRKARLCRIPGSSMFCNQKITSENEEKHKAKFSRLPFIHLQIQTRIKALQMHASWSATRRRHSHFSQWTNQGYAKHCCCNFRIGVFIKFLLDWNWSKNRLSDFVIFESSRKFVQLTQPSCEFRWFRSFRLHSWQQTVGC